MFTSHIRHKPNSNRPFFHARSQTGRAALRANADDRKRHVEPIVDERQQSHRINTGPNERDHCAVTDRTGGQPVDASPLYGEDAEEATKGRHDSVQ